jgi:hypothetical protein
METWFKTWAPLIGVASLSGVFNLIIAYYKFDRDMRSPFFEPKKSFGFWLWVFFQMTIPAMIFWLLYGATIEPPKITTDLIAKAITVGIAFLAFVNANIDLGFQGVPLDRFYFALTQLTYQLIAARENQKLAAFTTDLETELTQPTIQIPAGLNYLKNYFQQDFALKRNPVEQQDLLDRLIQASTNPQAIPSLILGVRRRDTLETLKRFNCRQIFLDKYFP